MDATVAVRKTAREGGGWGIALLASYMIQKEAGEDLADYLQNKVCGGDECEKMDADPEDVKGFDEFIKRYKAGFPIERAAVDSLK